MFGLLLDSWILHPWKVTWQRKDTTIRSCISYSKWWFSVAVFVFQACCFHLSYCFPGKQVNPLHPRWVPLEPSDNRWWLRYHLPGRLRRWWCSFFKDFERDPIFFRGKKTQQHHACSLRREVRLSMTVCWLPTWWPSKVVFVVATILVILWYVIVASKPCVNPEGWSVVACWLRSFPITCG